MKFGTPDFAVSLAPLPKRITSPMVSFICNVCAHAYLQRSHATNGRGEPVCNACYAETLRDLAGHKAMPAGRTKR